MPFWGDMLVPWRVIFLSLQKIWQMNEKNIRIWYIWYEDSCDSLKLKCRFSRIYVRYLPSIAFHWRNSTFQSGIQKGDLFELLGTSSFLFLVEVQKDGKTVAYKTAYFGEVRRGLEVGRPNQKHPKSNGDTMNWNDSVCIIVEGLWISKIAWWYLYCMHGTGTSILFEVPSHPFTCQVHVGAPHQTFTVVFDTGQGDPGCA